LMKLVSPALGKQLSVRGFHGIIMMMDYAIMPTAPYEQEVSH
jgi:hypothetical protein